MSGGVDSSVAAALLRDQDENLFGVTALMTLDYSRCCSDEDVRRAQRIAADLGLSHHVVDVHNAFAREIIEPFFDDYLSGRTPSPCVRCNSTVKFGALLHEAERLGAERIATGHYARVEPGAGGRVRLLRGVDRSKDQSYFLARLSQAQLLRTSLPLGAMTKAEVTSIAAERGLAARRSRESQELCFVDDVSHGTWIDVRRLDAPGPGDIVDIEGRKVGEHFGIHHYTIGQRKGLGIAVGEPVYVTALDAAANRVVVGPRDAVMSDRLDAREASWVRGAPPGPAFDALTQIRYNHEAAPSVVQVGADGGIRVRFREPQFAVTPGQNVAFYGGDEVLGCAWIV